MADFLPGLREVVPNQTIAEKCREFLINTGKVEKLKLVKVGENIKL